MKQHHWGNIGCATIILLMIALAIFSSLYKPEKKEKKSDSSTKKKEYIEAYLNKTYTPEKDTIFLNRFILDDLEENLMSVYIFTKDKIFLIPLQYILLQNITYGNSLENNNKYFSFSINPCAINIKFINHQDIDITNNNYYLIFKINSSKRILKDNLKKYYIEAAGLDLVNGDMFYKKALKEKYKYDFRDYMD